MDDADEIAEIMQRLERSGWSIDDPSGTACGVLASLSWIVTAHNGGNLIRAEGPTKLAAWRQALDQARAVGMLEGGSG